MIWDPIRSFLFRIDAEEAHRIAFRSIQAAKKIGGDRALQLASGAPRFPTESTSAFTIWDMPFAGRVGLAAGFDKNAEILDALPALGFSFAEIGTVTPRPQAGNPRPRLFRERESQSLFNRMGFNNLGAELIAKRVASARKNLPPLFRVGVNLGKNKDTPNEKAVNDYVQVCNSFKNLADYLVLNVSSPNTPGLRDLEAVASLRPIVESLLEAIQDWSPVPPLLVKLSPEAASSRAQELIPALTEAGIQGWVLSNTLAGAWDTPTQRLPGGWSGGKLSGHSRLALSAFRKLTSLPIISVGGILSEGEASVRVQSGADLIQIYTGWIYRGPRFPFLIEKTLKKRLQGQNP